MSEDVQPYVVSPHLETLLAKNDLDQAAAKEVFTAIIEGRVSPVGLSAFLTALRAKGETPSEIAAFVSVVKEHAKHITAPSGTLDTCGTGGDGAHTFNISTVTALVAAGMGIPVAKHGNRSVSSKSGSSEVLRELGVNIEASAETMETCLKEAGVCFLFAPAFHPGMRHAAPVRKQMGIRTVFNLLGPLSNPANADRQLLGVFDPQWCRPIAEALKQLNSKGALVVSGTGPNGQGVLDEVSTWGPTQVARLQEDGSVTEETIDPQSLGIEAPSADALRAESVEESAKIVRGILDGQSGPARDIVSLNAAAAAIAAGKCSEWKEALEAANTALDDGKAKEALDGLVRISNG